MNSKEDKAMKLEVFDPPMCCSSGVCGPKVDKKLVQFKEGDVAMGNTTAAKPKKGIFALLKESMRKTSEGCGPGCGCHVEDEKGKAKVSEATKDGKKE